MNRGEKLKFYKLFASSEKYNYIRSSVYVTLFLTLACALIIYLSYFKIHNNDLIKEAELVEETINDSFNHAERLLTYVGRQISNFEKVDYRTLENILQPTPILLQNRGFEAYTDHSLFSWSSFDWLTPDNIFLTFGHKGPKSMKIQGFKSFPNEVWPLAQNKHFKMRIGSPVLGFPSGLWVIPLGLYITSKKEKLLGTLTLGINIFELSDLIERKLLSNTSFLVLDENYKLILQSSDNKIDIKSNNISNKLKRANAFSAAQGKIVPHIKFNDVSYSYYKKTKHFPYIIVTGFKENIVNTSIFYSILISVAFIWVVGAACLVFFHKARKNLLHLTEESDKEREVFLQHINDKMLLPARKILQYNDLLLKNIKDGKVTLKKHEQIEYLESISKEVSYLLKMTTDTFCLSAVDPIDLIKRCIKIKSKIAIIQDIEIIQDFTAVIPLLFADEVRLKQIIVGSLSLAINYIHRGGYIKISANVHLDENNKQWLNICIIDNGFSLSYEDIARISSSYTCTPHNGWSEGTNMCVSEIKDLVLMHKGSFSIKSCSPQGKIIEILIPYSTDEREFCSTDGEKKTNVIPLFS
jgi:hypothetical protein